MNTHPAANLFPALSAAELRELADDIKANGLIAVAGRLSARADSGFPAGPDHRVQVARRWRQCR